MSTQTNPMEQMTEQMSKQFTQMLELGNLYRSQAEKACDFWFTQSLEAVKEGQKVTKEWMNASKTLSDEWVKVVEGNAKEATKVFTPAK